ncbi:hypothetical protein [Pararhizobium sp. PWRC1-1]|uniref:hypothetical protein n=1 Tax=Pararhizobium sp. PWRC1-1 TaxID=2804566 RepID=UPI003CF1E237
MFSVAKTAAISAIFISASMGVAFAGSHGDPGHNDHHDGHRDQSFMRGDDDITNDDTQGPTFVVPAYAPAHVYRSRLDTILAELRADNRSMNADKARGLLTSAEYQRLKADDAQIRHEAMAVADHNNGAIPAARYAVLQNQAQQLQAKIRRMA